MYAPSDKIEARDYGVARYGMEVKRLCDVLERHLAGYGDFSGTRCEKRVHTGIGWWVINTPLRTWQSFRGHICYAREDTIDRDNLVHKIF